MKLTSLLQLVDKLQHADKIDNLQQVWGVFGCVAVSVFWNMLFGWFQNKLVGRNTQIMVYSNQLARTLVSCLGSSDKVSQPTEKKEDERTEEIKINENLEVMRIMNKWRNTVFFMSNVQ